LIGNGVLGIENAAASFNHLVGADEERWWQGDALRLRGFEVDSRAGLDL
jgi:hypothetical protein